MNVIFFFLSRCCACRPHFGFYWLRNLFLLLRFSGTFRKFKEKMAAQNPSAFAPKVIFNDLRFFTPCLFFNFLFCFGNNMSGKFWGGTTQVRVIIYSVISVCVRTPFLTFTWSPFVVIMSSSEKAPCHVRWKSAM